MAESVLAAFKRFDQDGNGSISREELAAVLTIGWIQIVLSQFPPKME
jgi:Ca2+-binding EF-hand superfamily protein